MALLPVFPRTALRATDHQDGYYVTMPDAMGINF